MKKEDFLKTYATTINATSQFLFPTHTLENLEDVSWKAEQWLDFFKDPEVQILKEIEEEIRNEIK